MNQQFMKEKKIVPLVLQMSVPMILSMAVNALYNIVDSYFVAKISQNAMTALSIVFPVQNMINAIAVGFGIGLNAMIAYSIGANEEKKANHIASTGVFLSMIHGIILTICFFIGMPAFMQHFTKEQEIINLGLEYANWVLLFTVIIQVSVAYEKIFQSVGRMKVSMCSMMVGFIVNIVLDKKINTQNNINVQVISGFDFLTQYETLFSKQERKVILSLHESWKERWKKIKEQQTEIQ